jgi:hypothetical protein
MTKPASSSSTRGGRSWSGDDTDDTDERALCDIDGRIKGALTELLNSDGVRGDEKARGWVMERLLEVEREMRRLRKRRSCDGRRSMEVVEVIRRDTAGFASGAGRGDEQC